MESQVANIVSGALLVYRYSGSSYSTSPSSTITFQINPDKISRTISVSASAKPGTRSSVVKLTSIPTESIEVTVRFDAWNMLKGATDQRGRVVETDIGESAGVLPYIAAIEMLVYPPSASISKAQDGKVLISHPMPLVVFRWGERQAPVSIQRISVTEEIFGAALFPIQAEVALSMQVLSSSDVDPKHPAFHRFIGYLQTREKYAAKLPVSK